MKRKRLDVKGKAAIRCRARKAVSCLTVLALLFGTGQTVMEPVEASENVGMEYLCGQAGSEDHQHNESCLQTEAQSVSEPETEKVTEKVTEAPDRETEKVTEVPQETEAISEKMSEAQSESETMTEQATEAVTETEPETEQVTEANSETELPTEIAAETEDMTETEPEIETETESEGSRELVWEGEDYTIKVEYASDACLPEDVTLEAAEIAEDSEEYQTYLEEAAEAAGMDEQDQQITFARFFDVQFVEDGEVLEPKAAVTVTITYAQTVEIGVTAVCRTVHFAETGTEVLEVSAQQLEDGSTSFTHRQDSFSVLGTVVTDTDTGMAANDEGGSRTITFMIRENGELTEVGTADSYLIDSNGHPYITSETAEEFFGDYGYDPAEEPDAKFEYSYNDIYTVFYAQGGAATGYCMDVDGGKMEEGSKVWIYSSTAANNADARAFRIWEPESGYCYLTPINDSSYHVSLKGKAAADGTTLVLSKESGDASRWKKIVNSDGTVSFESKLALGKYLDLPNNTQQNSAEIQIYGNAVNRYWKLVQESRFSDAVLSPEADNQYQIGSTLESNGDIVCVYNIPATSICTQAGLQKLTNGGTFKLVHDITLTSISGAAEVNLTGNVSATLDLNGHTILYDPISNEGEKLIFKLNGTSSLTLKDSGQASETVVTENGTLYGNLASYEQSTKTLTYYVTESAASGTGTTETLKKHTVDLSRVGALESTSSATIRLILAEDSSSLNIEGGRYTNPKGWRAITAKTSGNVTISGGYICGNTYFDSGYVGGGIYVEGSGDLTISGGVIAANKASKAGGVYKGGSGTFHMTGGVISGNEVPAGAENKITYQNTQNETVTEFDCRGGGVQSDVDTYISGGYITNNRDEYYCGNPGYGDHFGGGITCYNRSMTITGGYITGNYSYEAGGGVGFCGTKFTMTGGFIAANTAQLAEGGGIRIQQSKETSLITGGYITDNRTNTTHDWGGGGIFLAQGYSLQIMNALFTNNDADGFGGGIGGCSTGQIIAVDNTYGGIAVYGNHAAGRVMAGSDGVASSKTDDLTAKNNETFMTSGYQDLFCALNSAVTGKMLGGGDQNWKGSCDYQPVTINNGEVKIASQMMGLTADPSQKDIAKAKGKAAVYISGNHSGTHGGGIMSNGTLILGEASSVDMAPGLKINGFKLFRDTAGSKLDTAQGQFTFQLLDSNGNVLKTASNAADGSFYIEPDIPKEAGTYTYYLKELSRDTAGMTYDIQYDTAVYRLDVTVEKKVTERNLSQENIFTINSFVVTEVQVTMAGSSEIPYVSTAYLGSKDHRAEVTIRQSETATTFVNTISEKPLYFRITKVDSSTQEPMSFVKFTLRDDTGHQTEASTKSDGIVIFQIKKGKTYTLYEECPDGYYKAGPWILEVTNDGSVTIWNTAADTNGDLIKDGEGSPCTGTAINNVFYYDYKIENTRGYSLPNTGGMGTLPFAAGGMALITAALLGRFSLRRRKKHLGNEY